MMKIRWGILLWCGFLAVQCNVRANPWNSGANVRVRKIRTIPDQVAVGRTKTDDTCRYQRSDGRRYCSCSRRDLLRQPLADKEDRSRQLVHRRRQHVTHFEDHPRWWNPTDYRLSVCHSHLDGNGQQHSRFRIHDPARTRHKIVSRSLRTEMERRRRHKHCCWRSDDHP